MILFESFKHPALLLFYGYLGLASGFVWHMGSLLAGLFNSKIIDQIVKTMLVIIFFVLTFFANLIFNLGELRPIFFIIWSVSFVLGKRLTILLAKNLLNFYNFLKRKILPQKR